jgi:hypothetical protein
MNRGRAVAPGRAVCGLAIGVVAALAIACTTGGPKLSDKAVPLTTSRAERTKGRASTTNTTTTAPATTTTTTLPVVPGVDPVLEKQVWDAYLAASIRSTMRRVTPLTFQGRSTPI